MIESVSVLIQWKERGGGPFSAALWHEWFADWEAEHSGWLAPLGGMTPIARTNSTMAANPTDANAHAIGLTLFEGWLDFIAVTPTALWTLAVFAGQKLKVICRSMLRFEAGEEKKPPASALDLPNSGDSRTPTGCARFTELNTFRAMAANVSE